MTQTASPADPTDWYGRFERLTERRERFSEKTTKKELNAYLTDVRGEFLACVVEANALRRLADATTADNEDLRRSIEELQGPLVTEHVCPAISFDVFRQLEELGAAYLDGATHELDRAAAAGVCTATEAAHSRAGGVKLGIARDLMRVLTGLR